CVRRGRARRRAQATRARAGDDAAGMTGNRPMRLCGFEVGLDRPMFLIAGPYAIESRQLALDTAGQLREITGRLGVPFIYKSSFDKANRSSGTSFRGPGIDEGLKILDEVRRVIGVPVLTDVHEIGQIAPVAAVV